MKLTIEIQCDNQPFVEDQGYELKYVLHKVSNAFSGHGYGGDVALMDSNGNIVGRAVMVDE